MLYLRRAEGEGYREYNFAPSGQWAAYTFSGYRDGMADLDAAAPQIQTRIGQEAVEVTAVIEAPHPGETWTAGLAVVLEDAAGGRSYWALRHAPGKPDFHHSDGFVAELTRTDL